MKTRREHILRETKELMVDFLYYARKEDEVLPVGSIEDAIIKGEVSSEEILRIIRTILRGSIEDFRGN